MASITSGPIQQCELTGNVGYLVQGFLGILAFASLVIKRQYEHPKRQLKIWVLDTSKQGISLMVAHVLNVILAMILSSKQDEDPCNWYFITILFDTTIGVLLCYIIFRILEQFFEKLGLNKLRTGNYFKIYNNDELLQINDDNIKRQKSEKITLNKQKPIILIDYYAWLAQLLIWVGVVVGSKTILYFIQQGLSWFLLSFAEFFFSALDETPNLKLIIVMFLIPLVLNCLQCWVQDNFLKKQKFTPEEQIISDQMFESQQIKNMGTQEELQISFDKQNKKNKSSSNSMVSANSKFYDTTNAERAGKVAIQDVEIQIQY